MTINIIKRLIYTHTPLVFSFQSKVEKRGSVFKGKVGENRTESACRKAQGCQCHPADIPRGR